jgi:hypothetical protein
VLDREGWIETRIRARAGREGQQVFVAACVWFRQPGGARVDVDLVPASLAGRAVRFCASGCC